MDYLSLGLVSEELEYVDHAYRTIMSVHTGLCSCGIYIWGSEEQKQRLLRPLASGERFGAFGLTEPNAGSDVAGMKATARRDGDSYILNGEKTWVSYADYADTFLIFAKTDPEARGAAFPPSWSTATRRERASPPRPSNRRRESTPETPAASPCTTYGCRLRTVWVRRVRAS
jgi:alkylation response protein AidB-like acyl-CoA dehydrogenase